MNNLQIKEINLFNKIHSFFSKFQIQIPHYLFLSKIKKIKLEKGDLVIFDERVLHAGGKINFNKPKLSIFFGYGLKNNHTKNHLDFLHNKNKTSAESYKNELPEKLIEILNDKNLYFN